MNKLTIGLCVYDDFHGVYFTLQSIRMYHKEVLDRLEFVIINNNPKSEHGKEIHKLTQWIKEPLTYVEFDSYSATSLRHKIFELANTEYVMVMDCHVLLESNSLQKLLRFYDEGKDQGNLLQGPLLYDDLSGISTHFDLNNWGGNMWGTWALDQRGIDKENEPFEIPAQGLGIFSCRKDAWLGFNKKFRGFGGEEGYIHEKFRKEGKKTLCLPFLRWLHRFGRPDGPKFNPSIEDKFRNYMIGFHELGKDLNEVINQFKGLVSDEYVAKVKREL